MENLFLTHKRFSYPINIQMMTLPQNWLKYWIILSYLIYTTETYSTIHLKTALGFSGENIKIRKKGISDDAAQKKYIQFQMIPTIFNHNENLDKNNSCQIFQVPQRRSFLEIYSVRCKTKVLVTYITIQIVDKETLVKVDEFKQISEPRQVVR